MQSYTEEIKELSPYCEIIELVNEDARIALSPSLQGKVLTSCTHKNEEGFGWLNHKLIKSKELQPHIQAFGGEDRFWIGPEAGQFGIFFKPNEAFTFSNWNTPPPIDTEAFNVLKQSNKEVVFSKKCIINNYQNFNFKIEIERRISIYTHNEVENTFQVSIPKTVKQVAYSSNNKIFNRSEVTWSKKSGLLNIWILGMFKCSADNYSFVPLRKAGGVTENYFEADLNNRIWQTEAQVIFKVDGNQKSKIGISPLVDKNWVGCIDYKNKRLTLVRYTTDKKNSFLNSLWKIQEKPFNGDSINIYNDGPNEDGSILGPYFELETSSSSKELKKDEHISHKHCTFHFEGELESLNEITKKLLQTDLNELKNQVYGS